MVQYAEIKSLHQSKLSQYSLSLKLQASLMILKNYCKALNLKIFR